MKNNNIIILTGPTASGKTQYAINLAKAINGHIVNFDSLQVYKHIPIISASPSEEEKAEVPHYLYNYQDPSGHYSFQKWQQDALVVVESIIKQKKVPILVGGTPMYARKICDGIHKTEELQISTMEKYKDLTNQQLQNLICQHDDNMVNFIATEDRKRLVKAYNHQVITGKSLKQSFSEPATKPFAKYNIHKIMILPKKEIVLQNCETRLQKMLDNGVVEEIKKARQIAAGNNQTFNKATGFKEISRYLDGEITIEEAFTDIAKSNKKLVKHQFTWFNNKFHDFHKHEESEELNNTIFAINSKGSVV